jgi:hypothetical protein
MAFRLMGRVRVVLSVCKHPPSMFGQLRASVDDVRSSIDLYELCKPQRGCGRMSGAGHGPMALPQGQPQGVHF